MNFLDPKSVTVILGTLALGIGFVILVERNDMAHALTIGALLVPSLGQTIGVKS